MIVIVISMLEIVGGEDLLFQLSSFTFHNLRDPFVVCIAAETKFTLLVSVFPN